jgi:hypothetical protein
MAAAAPGRAVDVAVTPAVRRGGRRVGATTEKEEEEEEWGKSLIRVIVSRPRRTCRSVFVWVRLGFLWIWFVRGDGMVFATR